MRAHFVQHVPFEGHGAIAPWLERAGARVTSTRLFAGAALPDPDEIDLLVVMGGPMSVNDEDEYPWLAPEKAFIRRTIESGRAVLGVCLGAQLIASAMGARVYPGMEKEIGWFPVHARGAEAGLPSGQLFSLPSELTVFHWHGETFDMPAGAVPLTRSAAFENQAFQLGDRVVGLQFHLETTPESAGDLVRHCRADLVAGRYIQSEDVILAAEPQRYERMHAVLDDLLKSMTARLNLRGQKLRDSNRESA